MPVPNTTGTARPKTLPSYQSCGWVRRDRSSPVASVFPGRLLTMVLDREPLHVGRIVPASPVQRNYVIDLVAGTSASRQPRRWTRMRCAERPPRSRATANPPATIAHAERAAPVRSCTRKRRPPGRNLRARWRHRQRRKEENRQPPATHAESIGQLGRTH